MTHKPPSINRLSHYENPIPMAGDPPWDGTSKNAWEARQRAVYQEAMRGKKEFGADQGADKAQVKKSGHRG